MVVEESQEVGAGNCMDNMETLPLVVHQVDTQVEMSPPKVEDVEVEAHPIETPGTKDSLPDIPEPEIPEPEIPKPESPQPPKPKPPRKSTKSPINCPSRRREVPRLKKASWWD